jgi:cytochrome c oxidase subunit I+III
VTDPHDDPADERAVLAEETDTVDELDRLWDDPPGLWGKLKAVQNDAVGVRLVFTGFFFLLLGGSVDSFVMRLQLARPEQEIVSPQLYNELFTNHGSVTMFLVILPIFEGLAILLLPTMLGSREMPFPRLGAFSYWTFLFGGLLYYSSTLFQLVPDAGWFAYTPLSLEEFSPDLALDFWVLGLGVAEVGAIAAAVEIIIGILKMRAPGMTLTRMPLYAWAMLVTAFMILFAFTPLIVGSLLLELERGFDMPFFDPQRGGSSLLWQHLFWIFGHPEVYIQFLPATGIVSMVLPVMVRRRIAGYTWMVAAAVAIGFLSFGLWAHHMFTTGLPGVVLAFFAAASMVIAIPAGVQIFSWVATIWNGRAQWTTAFLFCIGFLVIFVAGGITGVMVAAVPFDQQAHDSYFVVAHLHYVLIGGVAFPMFAGAYYWYPKFTGKLMSERIGRWNFWLLFAGVNVVFFPMHIVGLLGMTRRIYTYPEEYGWGTYNLISSLGLLLVIPGLALFVLNLVWSWFKGQESGPNPWGADSLEWAVPSPPAQHSWTVPPIVRSRNPLWDQDELHRGDPATEKLVHALSRWPLRWRAVLVISTGDAKPQEIFRVSNPSIWPLLTAVGVVGIFASELLKLRWGILASAAWVVVCALAWNRPDEPPMTVEEEEDFEREHGVPVRAYGSLVVPRWGMALAILFGSIFFGSLLLAYYYLRLENPTWPPEGTPGPSSMLAFAATALVVAGAITTRSALRAIRDHGDAGALLRRLLGGAVLGAAGAFLLARDLVSLDFGSVDHSYGAIFHTLGTAAVVVVVMALIMTGSISWYAAKGHYGARRWSPVDNVTRFWIASAVLWTAAVGTLYGAPVVT